MVFNHEHGDELFQGWQETAKHPEKLNLDWGKTADGFSLKGFLKATLTLFNCATTETRLRFLSDYILKDPYVAKFWECLNVTLHTDSINHPSPKLSDHVSTTLYIISHDEVVNREQFKEVRKEMSQMFALRPNFLYGILGYLSLHFRSKSCNTEIIAVSVQHVVTILGGVFKLVDPSDISVEFRYEAKLFVEFAWELENRKMPTERTGSLALDTIQQYISKHSKRFPFPKQFKGCSHRIRDAERERLCIAEGRSRRILKTPELAKQIEQRMKENKLTLTIQEYLASSRRADGEGWDDEKPKIHRTECILIGEEDAEPEEETKPMNNEEAIQYIEVCRSVAGSVGRRSPVFSIPTSAPTKKPVIRPLPLE
ncbi:hypothetical protein ABW20_dc0106119 [Dactylellina cionopaga]|nr:hypothetical protein ABW20_dc0106119 [Dactylellina cionopaga]